MKATSISAIDPTQDAIAASIPIQEQPAKPAEPERKQDRIHQHRLIGDEGDRPAHHIPSAAADIVHQFEERKIVADQPDQVREKNQERAKGADPDPGVREKTPLRREEQRDENGQGEKGRCVYLFSIPSPMRRPNQSQ